MAKFGKPGLLDQTVTSGEEQVAVLIIDTVHGQHGPDALILFNTYEVDDGFPACGTHAFWNLVHLEPVHAPFVGEEQNVVMRARCEQLADVILFLGLHTLHTQATALLRAELLERGTLDVAGVRDADRGNRTLNQVFVVDVTAGLLDLSAALVAILIAHLDQFLTNHSHQLLTIGEQVLKIGDPCHHFVVLRAQIVHGQPDQLVKTHFQNCGNLTFAQLEASNQPACSFIAGARVANDFDDLVDVVSRDQ